MVAARQAREVGHVAAGVTITTGTDNSPISIATMIMITGPTLHNLLVDLMVGPQATSVAMEATRTTDRALVFVVARHGIMPNNALRHKF